MARPATLSGTLIGPLATRVSIRCAPKDRLCVEVPPQRSQSLPGNDFMA
jgi:hypothetical protein